MDKPFKTVEEQVALLESRGMATDSNTPDILLREGYYSVVNGDLILSHESHNPGHENMYIATQDDRQVHVEHVAYFQSQEAF